MATFVGGENLSAVISDSLNDELNPTDDEFTLYTVPAGSYARVFISEVSMTAGDLFIGKLAVSNRIGGSDPDELHNENIRTRGVYIGEGEEVSVFFNTNTSNFTIRWFVLQYQVPA